MAARLTSVLATMRGLALTHRFEPRTTPRDLWSEARPVLVELLLGGLTTDAVLAHSAGRPAASAP